MEEPTCAIWFMDCKPENCEVCADGDDVCTQVMPEPDCEIGDDGEEMCMDLPRLCHEDQTPCNIWNGCSPANCPVVATEGHPQGKLGSMVELMYDHIVSKYIRT